MIEHIHKDVCTFDFNKHGESIGALKYNIDFDVEYEKLNPMCRDLLKIIKDENCFKFWICCPQWKGLHYELEDVYFDMEWIDKITFHDYYLIIDRFKVFYNAIFNFGKAGNWR